MASCRRDPRCRVYEAWPAAKQLTSSRLDPAPDRVEYVSHCVGLGLHQLHSLMRAQETSQQVYSHDRFDGSVAQLRKRPPPTVDPRVVDPEVDGAGCNCHHSRCKVRNVNGVTKMNTRGYNQQQLDAPSTLQTHPRRSRTNIASACTSSNELTSQRVPLFRIKSRSQNKAGQDGSQIVKFANTHKQSTSWERQLAPCGGGCAKNPDK